MRVAVDASCLAWPTAGGTQRYLRNVLAHLAVRDDVNLELLVNGRDPIAGFENCTQVTKRVRGGVAWRAAVVSRHLARRKPDVFWAPRFPAPLVVPCPWVLTLHDIAPALRRRSKAPLEDLAFRTTFPWSTRRADGLICVSHNTLEDAVRLWAVARDRARVVPLGVDGRFSPGSRDDAHAAVEHAFGLSRPYVLFVGSIEVRKGLELLLDTAELAYGRGLDFVVAGARGYGSESIVGRAKASAHCRLLGYVTDDELVDLYRGAEVVALPSHYEGFGLTALEAMACGTPAVVASGSGSLPELFGGTAIIVETRTPEAWLEAIDQSRAERSRLSSAGLELASRYGWAATAVATLEVLEGVTS